MKECDTHKIIDKLLKSYQPEAIRAAVLQWWIRENQVEEYLHSNEIIQRYLDLATDYTLPNLKQYFPEKATLKIVEATFERIIDANRRKTQGAIYTPDHIIDYLIQDAYRETQWTDNSIFLDPACGSGGFPIRVASFLHNQTGRTVESFLYDNIAGIDNDIEAIDHAKCLLSLYASIHNISLCTDSLRFICKDTLLTPTKELLSSIGANNGVNILATNPPYVKLQTLDSDYRLCLSERYPEFTQYNFGLALLFLLAGKNLLSDNGQLAFITQNNLFTSLAGEETRRFLQDEACIRRIVDFGHYRVFKNVLAYTCLVFMDNKTHCAVEFERTENPSTLPVLQSLQFGCVPLTSMKPRKWRLAKPLHLDNLMRIENIGLPLGKLTDIRVGFATLKDKVFFCDMKDEKHCMAVHPETKNEYPVEIGLTKLAIKIADIKNELQLPSARRRIIFPYEAIKGKYRIIPEQELKMRFPTGYQYLLSCKTLLEARDKGKRLYEAWYAWGRTQGREANGPKLLTKTFSKQPKFYFDATDSLFCNGYGVSPISETLFFEPIPLEIIKIVLESRVMHYYAKLTSFQIDGNYQCYQKNFIETFSIPDISSSVQEQLLMASQSECDNILIDLYDINSDAISEILGVPIADDDDEYTHQQYLGKNLADLAHKS